MDYIQKNLLENEEILYRTKKHPIIFLIPVLWTCGIFIFLANSNPYVVKLAFAPAIAALLTWANQLLDYYTAVFVVTNKRVLMKEGFFFRHTNDLDLLMFSNIDVNQSLLGRFLDYGTVIINPFGGEMDFFPEIAHPYLFKKEAQEAKMKLKK